MQSSQLSVHYKLNALSLGYENKFGSSITYSLEFMGYFRKMIRGDTFFTGYAHGKINDAPLEEAINNMLTAYWTFRMAISITCLACAVKKLRSLPPNIHSVRLLEHVEVILEEIFDKHMAARSEAMKWYVDPDVEGVPKCDRDNTCHLCKTGISL